MDRRPPFRLNVSLQDVTSSNISLRSDLEAGMIDNFMYENVLSYQAQDRDFQTRSIYEEQPISQYECESK